MSTKVEAQAARDKYRAVLGPNPLKNYGIINVGCSGDKGRWSVSILYNAPSTKQHLPLDIDGVPVISTCVSSIRA